MSLGNVSISKLYKTVKRLRDDLARKPLPEEVATELGIAVSYLRLIDENIEWYHFE